MAGTQTGTVRVIRIADDASMDLAGHQDSVESLAFSPDGRLLATGSRDRTVCLWLRSGVGFAPLLSLPSPSGRPVLAVRFSPDGQTLAVLVQNERAVRLWHLDRLQDRLARMGLGW